MHRGVVVACTLRGVRTLEIGHPPTYYFPPIDVDPSLVRPLAAFSLVCHYEAGPITGAQSVRMTQESMEVTADEGRLLAVAKVDSAADITSLIYLPFAAR